MKKKLFNALSVMLVCVLAVLALVMLTKRIQNKILFIGDKATVWVMTGSMDDTIPAQTYIMIKKVTDAEREVEIGDVITFYSNDPMIRGQLNTHRVVDIDRERGCFVTKGDNAPSVDQYDVPYTSVVGKYVKNLRFLTVIGRFYATTAGFVCTIAVLLVLICAAYIPDIIRTIKGKDDEEEDGEKSEKEKEMERRVAAEVERLRKENEKREENEG